MKNAYLLKNGRLQKNFSTRDISAQMGCSEKKYISIEEGKIEPSSIEIVLLAKLLSLSGEDFLPKKDTTVSRMEKFDGNKLFRLRKEKKMSCSALGKQLGVSGVTIKRWENSSYNPKKENIDKISAFFCVDKNYFDME